MKIYLAGPDVFRPDALEHAEAARQLLARHGHEALIPLDNDETTAAGIYRANIRQIAMADAVIANLAPFRGSEPDSGTCFEVGYAIALGKPVIGYLPDGRPQIDKLREQLPACHQRTDGRWADPQGQSIEDFGLPLNLMLAVSSPLVTGTLDDVLVHLTKLITH